jgi:glycosyltransferase involved in cell wall biosynthesis
LGIPAGHRWSLDDWHEPEIVPWLMDLHRKHQFDAVLVTYVFHSAVLKAFPDGVLKVIETQDAFGDRHLRYIEAGKVPEWYSTSIHEEIRGLSRADVVLAIQEREAVHFRDHLPAATKVLTVCPFMDDTPPVQLCEAPRAVVVASGNTINRDGVQWFLDAVFPTVREAVPDFELVLVGDICSHFGDMPGVVCLGRLPELRNAYEAGAVALNPVLFGTGFCIKSLEALTFGMPFLTTHTGSRGMESLSGRQAFIEVPDYDGAAMAKELVALLQDRSKRLKLGETAWEEARSWNLRQRATLAEVFSPKSTGGLP